MRNYILFADMEIFSYCLWRDSDILKEDKLESYNWWNTNYSSYSTNKKSWIYPDGFTRCLSDEEIVHPEDIMSVWLTKNSAK